MDRNMVQPLNIPIGPRLYRLQVTFITIVKVPHRPYIRLTIPAGYENDGASVPRYLWSFLRPDGIHRAASIVHDFLYDHGGMVGPYVQVLDPHSGQYEDIENYSLSKDEADMIFRNMLLSYGVDPIRSEIAYNAVKYFGRGNF